MTETRKTRKKRTPTKPTTSQLLEFTASYEDVLEATRLAACSVHPCRESITIVQDGNAANTKTFEKSPQGFGQAICWMNELSPVMTSRKYISETALYYALNSLPLRINIEPIADSSFYAWQVLDQQGEEASFLEAMKKAINVIMRQYLKLTE